MHVCVVCMYVYMYVCSYVCINVLYVCMYVCLCVCMYLIITCPKPHDHITLGVCILYSSTELGSKLMVIFVPRFPKKCRPRYTTLLYLRF